MKIQVSFAKLYREANNRHEHKKNPPSSGFFINTSQKKVIKNVDMVSISVYYNNMFNRMEEW
ncbi:hypothetical protein EOX42_04315 [Salmonella enterica]|nr:hypothetical protein [Salmonella enterica]ECS9751931.1 hypothetical protein [Salmonella enterica]HAC6581589.1 hypothetical protein [Salmonella enterica subsp. enterica serovar Saintpaul]